MKTKSGQSCIASVAEVERIALVLMVAITFSLNSRAQHVMLLADTHVGDDLVYNEYSGLTNAHDRFYFIGHGKELWTANPEHPDDLILLKSFLWISNLTVVGKNVFFTADDGTTGAELWKSNGSANGTVLVKDIKRGGEGSSPAQLVNVRGMLYFSASDQVHGRELWKSNGSANGTVQVKDILPGRGNGNPTSITEVNGSVFFAANDGMHGIELWKSNGTSTGTSMVKDIRPGSRINSSPSDLVDVYGTLFFVAGGDTAGRELWKSDGSAAGTFRIKDILPGASASRIKNGTAVYRTLFFSATDGVHGQELWKSDGTAEGTKLVKDLTPGPAGSSGVPPKYEIANFKNIYGTLFFTAYQNKTYYVWKSNGTEIGTVPLFEARGPRLLQPKPQFTYFNNRIYYFNRNQEPWEDERSLNSFWSMNLNGADHNWVTSFETYSPTYPGVALVGGSFYLTGSPSEYMGSGIRMLRSDGTSSGTWVLDDDISTRTAGSDLQEFTHYNGRVFFRTDHSYYSGHVLWVTDGTPEGTSEFVDFGDGINKMELVGSTLFASIEYQFGLYKTDMNTGEVQGLIGDNFKPIIRYMTQRNGLLYFSNGRELWRSDGSREGTIFLKAFHRIITLDAVGGGVMFRVLHENGTDELWGSTGTASETFKIKTLRTGGNTTDAGPSVVMGNTLYFVADDGVDGSEVWKSNGTSAGTQMVANLRANDRGDANDIRHLMVSNGSLFISAMGEDGKWGLYKSDGTSSGTIFIRHIAPIVSGIAAMDRLYLFTTELGASTPTLWRTDGSADGTLLVKHLTGDFDTLYHEAIEDVIYFSTNKNGPLWRTDGTECGTFVLEIGSKGAYPITALNNTLIFGSEHSQAGYEPHALNTIEAPGNPCGRIATSIASEQAETQDTLSSYPNPFTHYFTLRIGSRKSEGVIVKAFTLFGEMVEDLGIISSGSDRQIGQAWSPGIYILHVTDGSDRTTLKVRKQ